MSEDAPKPSKKKFREELKLSTEGFGETDVEGLLQKFGGKTGKATESNEQKKHKKSKNKIAKKEPVNTPQTNNPSKSKEEVIEQMFSNIKTDEGGVELSAGSEIPSIESLREVVARLKEDLKNVSNAQEAQEAFDKYSTESAKIKAVSDAEIKELREYHKINVEPLLSGLKNPEAVKNKQIRQVFERISGRQARPKLPTKNKEWTQEVIEKNRAIREAKEKKDNEVPADEVSEDVLDSEKREVVVDKDALDQGLAEKKEIEEKIAKKKNRSKLKASDATLAIEDTKIKTETAEEIIARNRKARLKRESENPEAVTTEPPIEDVNDDSLNNPGDAGLGAPVGDMSYGGSAEVKEPVENFVSEQEAVLPRPRRPLPKRKGEGDFEVINSFSADDTVLDAPEPTSPPVPTPNTPPTPPAPPIVPPAPIVPPTPPAAPNPREYKNPELRADKLERNNNFENKLGRLEGEYKGMEGEFGMHEKHTEAVKKVNREIFISEDEKVWNTEKVEAEAALETYRAQYIELHKKSIEDHKNRPWTQKFKDLITLRSIKEKMGKVPPHETSPEFKEARAAYEVAKKRYGNAIANLHINKAKQEISDYKINPEKQKEVEAQISADLLMNVSAKEYENLKTAKAESMPPQERNLAKKLLGIYTNSNKYKRLVITSTLLGLGLSAGGVGALAIAGIVTGRAAAILGSTLVGGAVSAYASEKMQRKVGRKEFTDLNKAKEGFSLIQGDMNKFEDITNQADKERFKAALKAAGLGAAAGVLVSGGIRMGSQLEALQNMNASVSNLREEVIDSTLNVEPKPSLETISGATKAPIDTQNTSVPGENPKIDDLKFNDANLKEENFNLGGNNVAEKYDWKGNIETVEEKSVPAKVNSTKIVNEIRDERVGGKMRIDSAEKSLLDTLKQNAEKLGYKPKEGLVGSALERDRNKFVTRMLEERMKTDKDILALRNAVTHDGNRLNVSISEDGTWTANIEQAEGRTIGNYKAPEPTVEPAPSTPATPTPEAPTTPTNPEPTIRQPLDVETKAPANNLAQIKEWSKIKNIPAQDFIKAKANIPEFFREHNLPKTTKDMTIIRNFIKATTESNLIPKPKESLEKFLDRYFDTELAKRGIATASRINIVKNN